nr:5-methyltetrahydrofolate--homocysteine methyltransferase [uncultured bacterium]
MKTPETVLLDTAAACRRLFGRSGPVLLDGGMGTMLQAAGLRPGELPELWSLTHPEAVTAIHRAYIEAGSQVVYANTFGLNRRRLRGSGHTVAETALAAVRCARRAAEGTDTLVALDLGPLGELLRPLGALDFEEAVSLFAETVRAGEAAGADLAVIETMTDLQEARAALLAVKENTSLPVMVTMSFEADGRTFTGCAPECMARTLEGLGADAIGVNCSLGPGELRGIVETLARHTRLPLAVKPNAGLPDPVDGHYSLDAETFAEQTLALTEAGAVILGGCCGTTPDFIRAMRRRLDSVSCAPRPYTPMSAVCSATRLVPVDRPRVIGERLNPTGKKRLQQALLDGDTDYPASVALAQADAGAELLDVNTGHPGVPEAEMLPRVAEAVQAVCPLPLQLDSTDPAALEAALRRVCGKAAVNSVNGSEASLSAVLPLVRKYGAAVVGLTLDETGLPRTAQERVAIARRILAAAEAAGIPREDVWIDCLTLTVSAEQAQAEETLAAVRAVTETLGLRTVLGVSNVSFGLPNRPALAAAFLLRALDAGLTLPILNPSQAEMMDAMAAFRALSGEDAGCAAWVERFADWTPAAPARAAGAARPAGAAATLREAIRRGLKAEASAFAREAIALRPPLALVEEELIPALDEIGADYERGKAFLPQLLGAAQAAQEVFAVVQQALSESGERAARGLVILATVRGDIHDIGKNIVRTLLENYGWEVLDLGRDVPPEKVAAEAERTGARLVGLSALMTTTLPAMEETVRLLKALPDPPHIMVGGAVVTQAWAERIGARYAKDARAAAVLAGELLGG